MRLRFLRLISHEGCISSRKRNLATLTMNKDVYKVGLISVKRSSYEFPVKDLVAENGTTSSL